MYITVAADKDVRRGSSTTAMHNAAYHPDARGDRAELIGFPNHSATEWEAVGGPLPFAIVDVAEGTHTFAAVRPWRH